MQTLLEDVRYGLRMLRKNPAFTAVALLTLALGIGANTAVFSIVNGVLLNSLPFSDPDKLVTLFESKPNFKEGSISYPNFLDWQRDNHAFTSIAAYRPDSFSLTGAGEAEQLRGEMVSADFFSILGVKPLIGRIFTSLEDQLGAGRVVLVSAGFWQRKLGSSPDVLGRRLVLDGEGYTILGVVPASFHLTLPNFPDDGEIYVPIGQWKYPPFRDRSYALGMKGIGRLRPGVTIAQAHADMDRVTQDLAAAFPQADAGEGATLIPLKEKMIGDIQPFLLMLLAAVCFVLLIACVNVANLLLARSTGRTREFAIRAALGAGQGRVVRQLLTESLLLAMGGAGLGLLLAAWGTRAALAVLPVALPRAEGVGLDTHVLIFTGVVSILAGILFGLAPALKTVRSNLQQTLKEGGRGTSAAHHRVQSVFVVAEMAMALVLLIGAGLMIRSLMRLWSVNPGFDPRNVLTFGVALPPTTSPLSPDAARSTYRQLHDKLASVPGVQAVSLSGGAIPMVGDDEELFWVEGQAKPSNDKGMNQTLRYTVDPGYFEAMTIPLKRGRLLTPQDNEHSSLVAVIDESFADKYFLHQDPIGKHINLKAIDRPLEIVGVVGHVKQFGLDADDKQTLHAQLYCPFMQMADKDITQGGADVVLRSSETHPATLDMIRNAVTTMNGGQFLYDVRSFDEIISRSLAAQRFSMILLGVFAALALLLASVGIYGVISYLVGQRTHEIGIRMALGAQRLHILRLILGRGGILALAGVGLGLASALGLTRLMASLLYGVRATDPLTFVGVAILLTVVALAACYIPARRATKVDPLAALRYE
ncbi:MAG TPA: ABC transporter permease [Terriglobales bacterium]|nr:ABC transporter permease [Terriglobales bacterium]